MAITITNRENKVETYYNVKELVDMNTRYLLRRENELDLYLSKYDVKEICIIKENNYA